MELFEFFGYLSAFFIGVILGLIGGGGSILTLPVLVYLLEIEPVEATAYSLFIVGCASLAGSARNMYARRIDYKTAIIFSIPSLLAVYFTRSFLLPAIPAVILQTRGLFLTKDVAIMLFFALLMILSSASMIMEPRIKPPIKKKKVYNSLLISAEGILVGIVTGIVGAGGGFLIVPALVLLVGLPMKKAVATSLLVIALKSLFGFVGDLQNFNINWYFLLGFTSLAVMGIFLGTFLDRFFQGKKLKKSFGWFVLIMGVYILWKEL